MGVDQGVDQTERAQAALDLIPPGPCTAPGEDMDYYVLDTIGQKVATCDDRDWARFFAQAPTLVRDLLGELRRARQEWELEALGAEKLAVEVKRLAVQLSAAAERTEELEAEVGALCSPVPEGHLEAELAAAAAKLLEKYAEASARADRAEQQLAQVAEVLMLLPGETPAATAAIWRKKTEELHARVQAADNELALVCAVVGRQDGETHAQAAARLCRERDSLRAELVRLRPLQGAERPPRSLC